MGITIKTKVIKTTKTSKAILLKRAELIKILGVPEDSKIGFNWNYGEYIPLDDTDNGLEIHWEEKEQQTITEE